MVKINTKPKKYFNQTLMIEIWKINRDINGNDEPEARTTTGEAEWNNQPVTSTDSLTNSLILFLGRKERPLEPSSARISLKKRKTK